MAWLILHYPDVLSVALFVVSDVLALIQYLRYPTNSGVGGVLVGLIKVLKQVGAKQIPPANPDAPSA